MKVRCNNCGWQGFEEQLVLGEDEEGFYKGCPMGSTEIYCKQADHCLMNIEDINIGENHVKK